MACGEDHGNGRSAKLTSFEQRMVDLKSISIKDGSLSNFTNQELVDELCKREGVVDVPIHQYNDTYYLPIAEKIIVVVKK